MLSNATYGQIMRFTDEALREIGTSHTVDRVTVIRGYLQMLALLPNRTDYKEKIARNLRRLSELAVRHNKPELGQKLDALGTTVDEEAGA
jgi:hypothetical protein